MESRESLTKLAIEQYFANVDRKDLGAVLACFNADAVFTIQSSFTVHEGRDDGIRRMFETFFNEYESILHTDFEVIADADHEAVSARFRAELKNGAELAELQNINHWYLEGGKFQRVYVWMSGDNVLT